MKHESRILNTVLIEFKRRIVKPDQDYMAELAKIQRETDSKRFFKKIHAMSQVKPK
jgi:hypothetical protein